MTYVSHALRHDKLARSIMDAEQTHDLQAAGPRKPGGQSQAEPRVWEPEDQEHVSKGGSSRSRGSVHVLCLPFSSIQTLGRQDWDEARPHVVGEDSLFTQSAE